MRLVRLVEYLLVWTCIGFANLSEAQELVPNGNFSQHTNCPYPGQIYLADFWTSPTLATPDYLHLCTGDLLGPPNFILGFQQPRSDSAFAGIYLTEYDPWLEPKPQVGYREYIQTPLTDSLEADSTYRFEMYVSLADHSTYATSDVGVYFSNGSIANVDNNWPLPLEPQIINETLITDSAGWQLISGNYTALGGENHLIIGNFKPDSLTTMVEFGITGDPPSYIFIDDVSLVPNVKTASKSPKSKIDFRVTTNPFNDILSIRTTSFVSQNLVIYDLTGRQILSQEVLGSISLNLSWLAGGHYICVIGDEEGKFQSKSIIKL